ncbi:hypothetical protein N431DRAFT_459854 [Stipitochalara longipes BDJ]|nr:hypothetical protein N431DRAFT_459854 [Stipitochalara longipes BDJ]
MARTEDHDREAPAHFQSSDLDRTPSAANQHTDAALGYSNSTTSAIPYTDSNNPNRSSARGILVVDDMMTATRSLGTKTSPSNLSYNNSTKLSQTFESDFSSSSTKISQGVEGGRKLVSLSQSHMAQPNITNTQDGDPEPLTEFTLPKPTRIFTHIPDFGVFINYDVDIIYWRAGCHYYELSHPCHASALEGNQCGCALNYWCFPLWSLPAKRLLFELPNSVKRFGRPLPFSRSSEGVALHWIRQFKFVASLCPLLEEFLLVSHDKPLLNPNTPFDVVPTSEAGDNTLRTAMEAFARAENDQNKAFRANMFFPDVKTEDEAAKHIVNTPQSFRRLDYHWWYNNPKLTFAKIKEH